MQHSALFLVVLAVSSLATTEAVTDCMGGVYTANSTYEANLRRMAAILPIETASSASLQAFRGVGYWPNRLRAFSLCHRYQGVSSSSCAACVADAFREAERECPYGKKVLVFARNCTLSLADFPRSIPFFGESFHFSFRKISFCLQHVADAFREAERECPYGKKVLVFARNCTLSLADFPRSIPFFVGGDVPVDSEAPVVTSSISRPAPPAQSLEGPTSWLELLGAGLVFQAIGFGWLFFLLLQEWRDKRRASMMRSSSIPSGDQ